MDWEKLIVFLIGTAALFVAGWAAICFVQWDFSVPLASKLSRAWLFVAAFIVVGAMIEGRGGKP